MTPQSSYGESSEFNMKTQQSTSKDEETQSILKLPSSELEIEVKAEAAESDNNNNKKKNIIVEHAEEATLPVKESSSVLLTPMMENKIIRTSPVNMEEGQKGMQAGEDSGRERLKKHRVEMAGRVWIPDMWGQEGLLKDWIDCSAFDASMMNSNIMLARAALIQEGRRASSTRIRIKNSC